MKKLIFGLALTFLAFLLPQPAHAGNYCADGTYSYSSGSGTCSWHGGIAGGTSSRTKSYSYSDPFASTYKSKSYGYSDPYGSSYNSKSYGYSNPYGSSYNSKSYGYSDPYGSSYNSKSYGYSNPYGSSSGYCSYSSRSLGRC